MKWVAGGAYHLPGQLRSSLLLLLLFSGWAAKGQSGGADVYVPAGHKVLQKPGPAALRGTTANAAATQPLPVAYPRTSQIILSSYADTPLAVPLAATDTNGNIKGRKSGLTSVKSALRVHVFET